MSRPKLLFLCQVLPYPPDAGVAIRSYNILRLLARHYDVTAFCFFRRSSAQSVQRSLRALAECGEVRAFEIPQEYSRARLFRDHVRSILTGRVYTRFAYDSRAFKEALSGALRSVRFDFAHVDSLDLSAYLPQLRGTPTICGHHNVESALLRRRAELEPGVSRRAYLRLQARFMEREELEWSTRVAMNLTVSAADRNALQEIAPLAQITIVPNGVDTETFQPDREPGHGLVFVGGMTWLPNRDAFEHFAARILPLLRAAGSKAPVVWVGRSLGGSTSADQHSDIQLTGHVDDIRPYVHAAACYVVPLRVGGGTRLKILYAWAMGKAVVSTSVGCEGLQARDEWNILIRDEPRDFADAVLRVLGDSELRERLGSNARATAVAAYSWDVIERDLIDTCEAVRAGGHDRVARGLGLPAQ